MPDIVYAGQRITADQLTYRSPYVVAQAAMTSNSSTVTSSSEVTILTTGSATFSAGRAYEVRFRGLVQHATVSLLDVLYLRFRRTTGAVTIRNLNNVLVANRATANRNIAVEVSALFTPASGFTDSVYISAAWDTGSTATFTFAGTAATPALLIVQDVGPASDYPGIATV